MPAILWRPSCRSRKKINSSGGFREAKFAADRFFNLLACAAVVVRQFVGGFTGFEALGDDISTHASTGNDGFAERNKRINDDILWLLGFIHSGERIQTKRESFVIAIDSTEVRC